MSPAMLTQAALNSPPPTRAPSVEAMRKFHVQIKNGATVVHDFPVFGVSHRAVQEAHEGLCHPPEYCWVDDDEERAARAGDKAREAIKDADCANFGQGIADRAARFDRPSELDMATWRRT